MLNLSRARNGGESLSQVGCHSDCAAACQHGAFPGHGGGGGVSEGRLLSLPSFFYGRA